MLKACRYFQGFWRLPPEDHCLRRHALGHPISATLLVPAKYCFVKLAELNHHCHPRISGTMAMPIAVPSAYPRLPVSMAGRTISGQPRAAAIAAAVAGPPTFALEAVNSTCNIDFKHELICRTASRHRTLGLAFQSTGKAWLLQYLTCIKCQLIHTMIRLSANFWHLLTHNEPLH